MADDRKSGVSMQAFPSAKSLAKISSHHQARSLSRTKHRPDSFGFSSVHGIKPVERTSQIGFEYKRPTPMYLPTYQLEPHVPFKIEMVKAIIGEVITQRFVEHIYNPQESPVLAMRFASELLRKVRVLKFNRYRILTLVTIGQKRAQSYNNALSFLWDADRDMYVDFHKEVNTAFIQVTVFGVYLD